MRPLMHIPPDGAMPAADVLYYEYHILRPLFTRAGRVPV